MAAAAVAAAAAAAVATAAAAARGSRWASVLTRLRPRPVAARRAGGGGRGCAAAAADSPAPSAPPAFLADAESEGGDEHVAGASSAGGEEEAEEEATLPPAPGSPGSRLRGVSRRLRQRSQEPCPAQLQGYRLTREEYLSRIAAQTLAREACHAVMTDASRSVVDKHHYLADFHMRWARLLFSCQVCWLMPGQCVCGLIQRMPSCRHRVVLYMHHSEYGRGCNSGSVLAATLGEANCIILVKGLREHDAQLTELLADTACPPLLLWPSEDAALPEQILAAEAKEKEEEEKEEEDTQREAASSVDGPGGSGGPEAAAGSSAAPPFRRRTLIAIDSTWSCAQRMAHGLPGPDLLPRVKLPVEAVGGGRRSLLAPIRSYGGDLGLGRVCTLEAVVALLRCLGEPPAHCEMLLDNLKLKVDALLAQKGRKAFYGTRGHAGLTGPVRKAEPGLAAGEAALATLGPTAA